jgi:dephospho-CoA kinase
MLRIGLTGNIASGKSTVADVWRRLGATVVDADELARAAVAPGSRGLRAVVAAFGPGVLAADGSLDRAQLRRIVFADEAARGQLEAIIHPEVAHLREEAERTARKGGVPVIVHDIPLLFEVGLEDSFDVVVLVDAAEAVRVERLTRIRGLPRAEAEAMVRAQLPASRKIGRADIVLRNDGTRAELERKATEAWRKLTGAVDGSA